MHQSAMKNCRRFFDSYGEFIQSVGPVSVIDLGSQNVNGSLSEVTPPHFHYLGVDFVAGNGVDVVLDDPYALPFDTDSTDVIISSSFISGQDGGGNWNDFVGIYVKDAAYADRYPQRVTSSFDHFTNGLAHGNPEFSNYQMVPEDQRKVDAMHRVANGQTRV